jgi:hypothetical protein
MEGKTIATGGGEITGGSSISGYTRSPLTFRPANENDKITVKVNGKEVTTTLKEARAAYDKAKALAADLEAKEVNLNKALADTQSSKEEKNKAVEKLRGEISDIQTQLGIANKYGTATAAAEDAKRTGGAAGRISLNSDQKVGAYVNSSFHHKLETLVERLVANTDGLKPHPHPPVGSEKPRFGGIHQ